MATVEKAEIHRLAPLMAGNIQAVEAVEVAFTMVVVEEALEEVQAVAVAV